MRFNLRPYQIDAVELLRDKIKKGAKRPILCLPTGAGKTVCFSHLTEQAQKKGKKVAVVCHRKELVQQAKDTMTAYGINPLMVNFGMVQTYVRSPHKIPEMDVCIIDECHIGNFKRFVDLLPATVQIIGATATPLGASNKKPLRHVFDSVVCPVQISELIRDRYLSKPTYKIWDIDESKLEKDFSGEFTSESQKRVFSLSDLQECINELKGKSIIFTSSISACETVADMIPNCYMVHSKMKDKQRDEIVKDFKASGSGIIVNCGILTAGFDDPNILNVVVYRATTSVTLWLQMVGRGSRVTDVKERFNVYDLGGNVDRLLLWEANRDWEILFKLQGKKLKDKAAPMKKCVKCEAIIYASQAICPYCGAKQPVKTKEELRADSIRVIDSYSDLPKTMQKQWSEMTVKELIERAKYGSPKTGRPYKVGWIVGQLKLRPNAEELLKEFREIKGYKQGWLYRELKNIKN